MDEPPWGSGAPIPYEPPPAFAPPSFRIAPMNETQALGWTSYPPSPDQPHPFEWTTAPTPTPSQPPAGHPARRGATGRRRRVVSVLTAGGVGVTLVAIAAVLLVGSGRTARSLSLPGSVDGYALIHTINGAQLASLFSATGGAFAVIAADDLAAAKVAVYSERDESMPGVVFLGFTAADSPSIGARLRNEPADTVAIGVLGGAGSPVRPQAVDAGPLGGALRCADLDVDGVPAPAGVWADHDTLGIVLVVNATTGMTTAEIGALTRDFRGQAEH